MRFKGHLVAGKPKDWKKNVFIDDQSLKDVYLENMSRRREKPSRWRDAGQDVKNWGHKVAKVSENVFEEHLWKVDDAQ